MTEDVRLTAAKVARQCACRGWIVGNEQPTSENVDAVLRHQQTEEHREWDREEWIEANTARVQVPSATLRKVA